jgi:hypothetical protein
MNDFAMNDFAMNDFEIAPTQSSPAIKADAQSGTLEMRGDSYPENSYEFFTPVMEWVEEYLRESQNPLRLDLHLLYLNTSSVKAMMDIFDMLQDASAGGRDVTVCWYYDSENERIAELAEEFKEDCTFPFEIVRNTD